MKNQINKTTITAIIILAATGVTTTGLCVQFVLAHPQIPWYVWATSFIPPFPVPSGLPVHMAIKYSEWLPIITLATGGTLGGMLLFLGLRTNNKITK